MISSLVVTVTTLIDFQKDLVFRQSSNDLNINTNDGNSIRVNQYFVSDSYVVESIELNNGFKIESNNINLLIQAMSEYCSTNGVTWTSELAKTDEDVQDILSQYYSN